MNRRTVVRVVPALLVFSLVLTGCCNENWKGLGEVSGTLTLNGVWSLGDINALTVQTVDNCDNKYVHFSAREGTELSAVRDALVATGTYTTDLELQEVIAGSSVTRFMVRDTSTFKSLFESVWSVEYKLKKDGSKVVNITYTFPE